MDDLLNWKPELQDQPKEDKNAITIFCVRLSLLLLFVSSSLSECASCGLQAPFLLSAADFCLRSVEVHSDFKVTEF